ncbi:DoxX family protein [Sphingobacterium sp. SGG-5]|uniref:DoxX family protein n=1 Tax=Sphingobacterium sp. SGG-5 TaxID=2710881 RepID=UPI0013EDC090|nr:DoxX family protein [Sphingobacterium sp. SGG-5]NGM61624.1 DoxX family protein [Sphingobacterium sp. SGG-5]
MNLVKRVEHWGDTHHSHWLSIVRMGLGVLLFARGISFIMDNNTVFRLIENTNFGLSLVSALHYIVFAHIVGGLFIMLGFQTRLAAIVQLPILFVAVFFVNITKGFSYLNSELWLSILVFVLLLLFAVVGSGTHSLDHLMDKPGYKREI